ncbi:MAG: right-handed parallel beta-helix repeat-containing protein, partial [bacterium]|nr:right-handed parallel beta-helix repeat-containing protein [bacterium]
MRIVSPIVGMTLCLMTLAAGAQTTFYVAPDGDDAAAGTEAQPFRTLPRAQQAARQVHASGQAVHVILRQGDYVLDEPLVFTQEDSSENAHALYMASPGETPRLLGGRHVTEFVPITDPAVLKRIPEQARAKVLVADLRAQGISGHGDMTMRGFPQPILPAPMELFFDGEPMTIARWPNDGFVKTGPIVERGSVPREGDESNRAGTFTYLDDRVARWAEADDVWMFGYWCWDWADESIGVRTIDTEKRTVTLDAPHHYGLKEGMRYYAFNLIEEIDQPGEYYVDRAAGRLYFWPPTSIEDGEALVSTLETPMVVMDNAQYVEMRGLTLECTRGTAVRILGGEGCALSQCIIRNVGNVGVIFGLGANDEDVVGLLGCSVFSRSYQDTAWNRNAGTEHRVEFCELYNLGEGGIILGGGDRVTLTRGDNAAISNTVHNYSRSVTTNRPAVWVDGCGNFVDNNRIYDAPHTAIMFWGNDHSVQWNEVYDVCKETGDVGAIYTGRDWTMRGNEVSHNFLHDIHGPGHGGAQGIYLDDLASGTTCRSNLLINVARGFLIGGGRDNIAECNILVDCDQAVSLDARGLGWLKPDGDRAENIYKKR